MVEKYFFSVIALIFLLFSCSKKTDWRTASRESAQIAPLPSENKSAMVQIYSAKAFSWRGNFSVHTWIATKEKDADSYRVYNVLMWAKYYGSDKVVVVQNDIPDRYWFGSKPEIIFSVQGERAEKMIPQIVEAVNSYPYQNFYRPYPGPNSNTFVSHVIRSVPEIGVELPSNAIGKDWIKNAQLLALSETKTGVQFSLYGLLGLTLGLAEGIEVNLLGLSFGIDFLSPALKLPIIGRVGMKDRDFYQ
jgi:hypothetical protein